jgi:hypothetical protein
MSPLRLLLLAPAAMLLGCGRGESRLDGRTEDILRHATKVQAFRIDSKEGSTGGEAKGGAKVGGFRRVGGFRVLARGKDQHPKLAAELADILADGRTYSDEWVMCFWPAVAFRVWKGKEVVEVLICFECDNLYCGPPRDRAEENVSFFRSPRRADLVRLAKRALPDDPDIQAIEE